jgi:hypothetical protein
VSQLEPISHIFLRRRPSDRSNCYACAGQAHRDLSEVTLAVKLGNRSGEALAHKVMTLRNARRAQHVSEVAVEVLNMGGAINLDRVLPESKDPHDTTVERLGSLQI